MNEQILKGVASRSIDNEVDNDGDALDDLEDNDLQVCTIRTDSILGQCLAQYIGAPAANDDGSISGAWASIIRGACL